MMNGGQKHTGRDTNRFRDVVVSDVLARRSETIVLLEAEISDLPAPDGPFIHPKAAERSKRLFVTASSRFRGRQLSSGGCATH